jgi:NADH dehydrogenase
MQGGVHAARTICERIEGNRRRPFVYHDRGSMAIIGRGSAIADIRGFVLRPIAWLAWLFLHIFELIGFRNRLVVMIEWATAYFTRQRSVRLITYQDQ